MQPPPSFFAPHPAKIVLKNPFIAQKIKFKQIYYNNDYAFLYLFNKILHNTHVI